MIIALFLCTKKKQWLLQNLHEPLFHHMDHHVVTDQRH